LAMVLRWPRSCDLKHRITAEGAGSP
jgi:hypothetical protein